MVLGGGRGGRGHRARCARRGVDRTPKASWERIRSIQDVLIPGFRSDLSFEPHRRSDRLSGLGRLHEATRARASNDSGSATRPAGLVLFSESASGRRPPTARRHEGRRSDEPILRRFLEHPASHRSVRNRAPGISRAAPIRRSHGRLLPATHVQCAPDERPPERGKCSSTDGIHDGSLLDGSPPHVAGHARTEAHGQARRISRCGIEDRVRHEDAVDSRVEHCPFDVLHVPGKQGRRITAGRRDGERREDRIRAGEGCRQRNVVGQ